MTISSVNDIPVGYHPLGGATVSAHLATVPAIVEVLGGDPKKWRVSEIGDGNLNLVFVVESDSGAVCVKQALPYLRLVGDSWPLPLSRNRIESEALIEQGRHAPGLAPRTAYRT